MEAAKTITGYILTVSPNGRIYVHPDDPDVGPINSFTARRFDNYTGVEDLKNLVGRPISAEIRRISTATGEALVVERAILLPPKPKTPKPKTGLLGRFGLC